MELEFDKEIDAILRKAQGDIGVSAKEKPNHLDADTIAAFVENALPQKAKLMYMEHFADCDRCRKQLSFAISMNAEADQASASIVSEAVAEPVIPWYQKFFRSQNLAIAMGALVLSFGGLIGYLALQNKDGSRSSDVAMEKAPAASAPYSSGAVANSSMQNSANVAIPSANAASTAANVIANSNSLMVSPGLNQPANTILRPGEKEERKELARSDIAGVTPVDPTSADTSSNGTAAPPPPPMAAAPAKPISSAESLKSKDNELALSARKTSEDNMSVREASPKAAAKRNAGLSKASGNVQQQTNTQVFDKGTTQRVGGKTFDNRNGVWYDLAYNGQSTIGVARGSGEYKKLDGSIKRIAENLGGTVVVMWKNKAYRIQ